MEPTGSGGSEESDRLPGARRGSRPGLHKTNTVDALFTKFYGFQSGALLVQVVEGRNLLKDHTFCTAALEGTTHQTVIVAHDVNPKWSGEFYFDLKDQKISDLSISVHGCRRIGRPKDIGHVSIKLQQLDNGQIQQGWHPLHPPPSKTTKVTGDIFLRLQYTSEVDRNRDYQLAKRSTAALMHSLEAHDTVILSCLCKVYESEELSKTIIRVFNAEGQALRLLIQLVFRDLKATASEDSLFRNDSMATKTIRNYFKMVAPDYLRKCVQGLLLEVIGNPHGFEVDPLRLKGEEVLTDNIKRLNQVANKFLDCFVVSVDEIPLNMRKFFHLLRQLVQQRFPNSQLKAVGALFFLRFCCPAIIAPDQFGVIDAAVTNPDAQRALTLVVKMIQNLANMSFSFKEEFMVPLNPFLSENQRKIISLYEKLSVIPSTGPEDSKRPKMTEDDKVKCLSLILGQLRQNFARVEAILPNDPRVKDPQSLKENQELLNSLKALIL